MENSHETVLVGPLPDGFKCDPVADGEGDWSEWLHPLPGFLMQCCDCGLIHQLEVAIGQANGDGPLNDGETKDAVVLFRMRRTDGK